MADNAKKQQSRMPLSVDSRCLLPLIMFLAFYSLFCEGKYLNVAVPTTAYYDLTQLIKSEEETSNSFHFEVLPSFNGQDELEERDILNRFLKKNRIQLMLGYYTKTVAVATEKLEIPFIVTSFGISVPEKNVLQVAPSLNDFVSSAMDIIQAYHWTQVGLFSDETILLPRVLNELARKPSLDLRLWEIPSAAVHPTKIKENLMKLRDLGVLNVFLLTPVSTTEIILETAKYLGMLSKPYSWLTLNMASEKFLEELMTDQLTNITTVNLVHPTPAAGSRTNYSIVERAILSDSIMLMDHLTSHKEGISINDERFKGRTGHVQFGENGMRNNFTLAVFNSDRDTLKQSGEWRKADDKQKLVIFPQEGEMEQDDDILSGKTIKVVSILEKPWLMIRDEPDNERIYEGYSYDLMVELGKLMDFKFDMYLVPDEKYGIRNQNGEWDGIMGELVAKKCTMGIAPLAIDGNRAAAIDFTVPFMYRGITVLIRSPEIQKSFFKFTRPLSTIVWFAVLGALVLFSVVLCIVERGGKALRSDLSRLDNLQDSCWYILGVIANGNTESSPVTVSGRVLASAWFFFSMILISTYTANLAAFLTVKIINPPISAVDDLLGQSKIKYGTVRDSVVQSFFQNATIEPYSLLNNQMEITDSNVNSTDEGLRKVKQGDYAFLWDASVNSYTASADCNYTNVGPAFDVRGFGLGLPLGTPYKENISLAILKLSDDGTLAQLEYKWWGKSQCADLSRPSVTPSSSLAINLENVAGIFFIVAGGIILALLGFLCEKRIAVACRKPKEQEHG